MQCIVLADELSFEQAAMSFVNPLTALGLVDLSVQYKSSAIIQTGAASQLGRMVVGICKIQNIPLINIVRRQEQSDLLKEMGAEHILNSSEAGWLEELEILAKKLGARVCFECVAGEISGQILNVMPFKSTMIVYGNLSQSNCSGISPSILIRGSRVEGFFLSDYAAQKGALGMLGLMSKAGKLMREKTFHSTIAARIGLEDAAESIQKYNENMTAGKYIICPNKDA